MKLLIIFIIGSPLFLFITCSKQNSFAIHLSPPPHNLSCYHCSTLHDGDSCRYLQLNNTETQMSCDTNQMFCSVILFRYSADSSEYLFRSVERGCEETCEEGCYTVGERVKLFLCRSCCTSYLCNYGSGAKSTEEFLYFSYLGVLSIALHVYVSKQLWDG